MEHRQKNASPINTASRSAAHNVGAKGIALQAPPPLQRKQPPAGPVVQRYVTFNDELPKPVIIGNKSGKVGYDLSNIDALVDTVLPGQKGAKRMILATLGSFLDKRRYICFDSVQSAAQWITTQGREPEATIESLGAEKNVEGGREIVYAFRVESLPKSAKQKSDVKKGLIPSEAFNMVIGELLGEIAEDERELETLKKELSESKSKEDDDEDIDIEKEELNINKKKALLTGEGRTELFGQWSPLAAKDSGKRLTDINKIRVQGRKPLLNMKDIFMKMHLLRNSLDAGVDNGTIFASRVQIDNSFMINANRISGKVTGLSDSINFSVGAMDHASYFMSTFEGSKGLLIRFALDKKAWRDWKTAKTKPQQDNVGPGAQDANTTLNDIAKPGVKYEMAGGVPQDFYKNVVAKDIPAAITDMEGTSSFKESPQELFHSLVRLEKAKKKLETELALTEKALPAERGQLVTANSLLTSEAPLSVSAEALYTALNLTKNALHSVRRQKDS